MEGCIFDKIAKKEIPAEIVYEDKLVVAFKDINPQAPYHVLIIPKKHLILDKASEEDKQIFGNMIYAANVIAGKENITNGYRLIINNGPDSNQEIEHLHMHFLAGKNLGKMLE